MDPTSLTVHEGDDEEYSVVLDSQPIGNVTVSLSGTTGTAVTANPTSLEFTASDWQTAQEVTVSAAEDTDALDETVTIVHTVTSSGDGKYDGIGAQSVAVNVDDDEIANRELTLTMPGPVHGDTDTDGKVNLGDTLTYTATATNSGNLPLTGVNVADLIIDTAGQDCAALAIGTTCILTGTHTINQSDVDAGEVVNTATASATGAQTKTLTRETAVDQARAITLEKTSTANGFDAVDDSIPYSYKVVNAGTVTLTGTLEIDDDRLPSGINCPDVPDAGLAPDQSMTCSGIYTVVQTDVDAAGVTNNATAELDGLTSSEVTLRVPWRAPQGTQPQLNISAGQVAEAAGSITLNVSLNPSSLQNVTVDYATSGATATAGSDYTAASGTLTFAPGDTGKTISITITDDDLDEDNETFKVTISTPVNAAIPAGTGEVSIIITDDDTAGVTVSVATLEVDEGDGNSYTVVLDSEPTANVTVSIGGTSGTDVSTDETSVTFTPDSWDAEQTVTVSAAQDHDAADEGATVTHTATSADAKYNAISVAPVAVSVDDDDTKGILINRTSLTVEEGDTTGESYNVQLATLPTGNVSVVITGQAGTDLSLDKTTLAFTTGNWSTQQTVTVTAADDADAADESAVLTHTASGGGYGSITKTMGVAIEDDAPDSLTVSFEQDAYTATEGAAALVTVVLSVDPERTVTIPITKSLQNGASISDYSGVPANVSFNSGDTEKTFEFSAADDDIDDGESIKIGFGTMPTGVSTGTTPRPLSR